jgi:hypothetical protein
MRAEGTPTERGSSQLALTGRAAVGATTSVEESFSPVDVLNWTQEPHRQQRCCLRGSSD